MNTFQTQFGGTQSIGNHIIWRWNIKLERGCINNHVQLEYIIAGYFEHYFSKVKQKNDFQRQHPAKEIKTRNFKQRNVSTVGN